MKPRNYMSSDKLKKKNYTIAPVSQGENGNLLRRKKNTRRMVEENYDY